MRILPVLLLLLQDDWTAARDAAKRVLRSPDPAPRSEALGKIVSFDRKESVELELEFWAVSTALLRQHRPLKAEKIQKMDAMPIKKKVGGGNVTFSGDEVQQKEEYDRLGREVEELEKKISAEEAILRRIREALAALRDPSAVAELGRQVSDGKDWSIRAAAAEALGATGTRNADLRKALKKEKDPRAQAAMIEALGRLKDREAVPEIAAVLRNKAADGPVKVAAVAALGAIGDPACVEPLIEALRDADGRLRDDANAGLVSLTGVDKHGDYKTWKDWYAQNREALLSGKYEKPARSDKGRETGTTFYGVPIRSKRLVFILDRSGSMAEPAEWKPDGGTASGPGNMPKPEKIGDRKIDVAKYELKRAILGLPEDARFNVIFFSHDYMIWLEDVLEPATPANKKKALEFVEKLDPEGQTNIFDSLEKGFLIQDLKDPRVKKDVELGTFKTGVDTIYLMSDGAPNRGRVTEPGAICAKVREMNRERKVVIHCIAVGRTADPEFMKRLAEENGGAFVHRK